MVTYIVFQALLLLTAINLLGCGGNDNADIAETEVGLIKPEEKEEMENDDFTAITELDADYYIDYENGTIPLGNLPIGARVVDPSWEWEFRTSANYSGSGAVKPVVWLIVAMDHYEGLDSHVTLLSEELIGQFTYDNSTHVTGYGYNHWGESGTHSSATRGLRPWLNSTGIHAGEGFYQAFSESFKLAVLTTTVPNKEWQNGSVYSTSDHVFIPSETELGDTNHTRTYSIGKVYAYLTGAGDAERRTRLDGATYWYWTRSPASDVSDYVKGVNSAGNIAISNADSGGYGVRPALNLKSGILVSEIGD